MPCNDSMRLVCLPPLIYFRLLIIYTIEIKKICKFGTSSSLNFFDWPQPQKAILVLN